MARPQFDEIVATLYDTVFDDTRWQDAMTQVAAATNSTAGVVFLFDKKTGRVPVFHGLNLPDLMANEYDREMARRDERVAYCVGHPDQRIAYDYLHTSEAAMNRSPYYNWIAKRTGCRYYLAMTSNDMPGAMAAMSLQRTAAAGHAQADEIATMERLRPHFDRVLALRSKIDGASLLGELGDTVLERTIFGVVATETDGRIVHASAVVRRLFERRDGLVDTNGYLSAALPADRDRLRAMIAAPQGDGPLSIRRPDNASALMVLCVPITVGVRLFGVMRPSRLILVADRDAPLGAIHQGLRQAFGFTRMQALLAQELLSGATLADAARALGVAEATARVHLRHVMAKTSTDRQASLIKVLAQALPLLRR